MAIYVVTMIEDYPLDSRTLDGIGTIERGFPQQMELTDEQAASIRGRGVVVNPWRPPVKRKINVETEPVEPAAEE